MGAGRDHITLLYKSIMELTRTPLTQLRLRWEEEFGRVLHDKEWLIALEHHKKVSRKQGFKNVQFNVLHRAYHTPARLKRFYPTSHFDCPRCHTPDAPFLHMFWT